MADQRRLIDDLLDRKPEAAHMIKDIFENNRKLADCAYHDFSINLTPERVVGRRWRCARCGGEIDDRDKMWYERGIKHERNKGAGNYEQSRGSKAAD